MLILHEIQFIKWFILTPRKYITDHGWVEVNASILLMDAPPPVSINDFNSILTTPTTENTQYTARDKHHDHNHSVDPFTRS